MRLLIIETNMRESKKTFFIIFFILVLISFHSNLHAAEIFEAAVFTQNQSDIENLYNSGITITTRRGNTFFITTTMEKLDQLDEMGLQFELLVKEKASLDGYHSYESIISELETYHFVYPELTHLIHMATTSTGRKVMALKISDNASNSEPESAFLFEFNIHGDEKISAEVGICLIRELLEQYDNDSEIQKIVDEHEIFIVPLLNPDGHVFNTRSNANHIDLNRNFGWWWDNSTGSPASQIEVKQIMQLAFDENFLFAISFHSGAQLVNYPFDSTPMRAPDDDLFQLISSDYGDIAGYPITNGWDWYKAMGISEESYYGSNGTLAVIVELSNIKTPSSSRIPEFCQMNIPAIKSWINISDAGIRGIVSDGLTGSPVIAKITIDQGGWPVWSDPVYGDFYRFLQPGTYSVRLEANGYDPEYIENVLVEQKDATVLNVEMNRSEEQPIFSGFKVCQVVTPRPWGSYQNETLPIWALGDVDDRAFSLGAGGWVVIDMGPNSLVTQVEGADFVIYEDESDGAQSYAVKIGQHWAGPFDQIGTGNGTTAFDLPDDIEQARYIAVFDTSNQEPMGQSPGADIDAIVHSVYCTPPIADFQADIVEGDAPLTVNFTSTVQADPECLSKYSWDFGDFKTATKPDVEHTYENPGQYTVILVVSGAGGADTVVKTDYITVNGENEDSDDPENNETDDSQNENEDDAEECCG